ncbi:hybrid sensor histidine kinase/response regulator [Roseomonas gilardii]|uniref:hybrid sensor histidine kinase/response regulator n=1 Tax=Roseomonas gilardii TaxID=257708 RepID=UPI0021B6B460|nr:hybrid sensor histidine kinase/response regulator [Roseomonas gilardii]
MVSPLRWIAARLRRRPDKEHEIALNRVAIALGALVYFFLVVPSDASLEEARWLCAAFAIATMLIFGHLVIRPGVSVLRRLAGIVLDLGILSGGLLSGGVYVAALYPLYLWVIFGNGFRFGIAYLGVAAGLSILAFGTIIHVSPYWQANYPLALGLLAGLIVLPGYAAMLIRKLSLARDQAEQASQAKSLFLASVSHELRTPVTAIIGMNDLLRRTPLQPEQREMTGTVQTSARALISLIDDLLNLSRLDAGRIAFEQVVFDPVAVLRDAGRLVTAQALEKDLRLSFHVTPRSTGLLRGDRRRLGEVLLNLAGNAVKFTQQGGVVLALDMQEQAGGILLRLEVSDTGIGIAPEAQERIFESFTQAHDRIANDFGGTGLGLSISRRLVRAQGGDIGVRSRLGRGSTLWLILPMEPAAAEELPAPAPWPAVVLVRDASLLPALERVAGPAGLHLALLRDRDEARRRLAAPAPAGEGPRMLILLGEEPAAAERTEEEPGPQALPDLPLEAARLPVLLIRPDTFPGLPEPARRFGALAILSARRLEAELPPVLRAAHTLWRAESEEERRLPGGRTTGRHILVVDDNRVNQKVLSRMLETGGHAVTLACNGEEALDLLERDSFDLVVMDVNMPVMGGLEATKLYRMASLGQPHLPIVALTADATSQAREKALEAGMDACLTKPIDLETLLDLVERLLAGKPPSAAPVRRPAPPLSVVPPPDEPPSRPATVMPPWTVYENPRPEPPPAPVPSHLTPHDTGAPDAAGQALLDETMLDNLETLGGAAFVADVVASFLTEAAAHLEEVQKAVRLEDGATFRDRVHALRSSAANVGALVLPELCRDWQFASDEAVRRNGAEMAARLVAEFEAVRAALLRRQALPPVLVTRRD